jgi:hypothetical protein
VQPFDRCDIQLRSRSFHGHLPQQKDQDPPPCTTMRFSVAAVLSLVAVASAADVPSLTPANYDALTDGKTVFIKFFAPWVRLAEHSFVRSHEPSLRWLFLCVCALEFDPRGRC